MTIDNTRTVLLRYAGKILLIDLGLFITTALVCWLGDWRTLNHFGIGLMIVGFISFLIGGVTGFGSTEIARNPTYRYIQSVMPNSLNDRTRQNWADMMESFSFLILLVSAGLLSLAAGWVVTMIFPS
jgi:hypothetical protein